MGKNRLEAFSDGVIAIIITIMVLELKVPHNPTLAGLAPLWPVFVSYVLSFIYVGIYWNKLQYADHPSIPRKHGGVHMLKAMFALIGLLGIAGVAHAGCPERPVSLCQIVAQNPVVVRAKVTSIQHLVDEDDPDGVAGWIYHLDVIKDYRYGKPKRLAVMSENTTSRISLETGKEYMVFASRNSEGQLETGNYCDPYSARKFDSKTEQQVLTCLLNEKARQRN